MGIPLSDFQKKGHRLETKRIVRITLALAEIGATRLEDAHLEAGDRVTLKGEARQDAAALAAMVHRLLTGEPPATPLSIAKLRPDLPGGVARAMTRALAQEIDANAFARAFADAFMDETVLPPHEPSMESGIWDAPKRERERKADPLPIRAKATWSRRASALAILAALFATWWLARHQLRRTRRRRE